MPHIFQGLLPMYDPPIVGGLTNFFIETIEDLDAEDEPFLCQENPDRPAVECPPAVAIGETTFSIGDCEESFTGVSKNMADSLGRYLPLEPPPDGIYGAGDFVPPPDYVICRAGASNLIRSQYADGCQISPFLPNSNQCHFAPLEDITITIDGGAIEATTSAEFEQTVFINPFSPVDPAEYGGDPDDPFAHRLWPFPGPTAAFTHTGQFGHVQNRYGVRFYLFWKYWQSGDGFMYIA